MAQKIAIASGKGGTGKTTVSVNLYWHLARQSKVLLVDCDVEEPNDQLFIKGTETKSTEALQMVPFIDSGACSYCGRCSNYCEYGAITVLQTKQKVLVDQDLCHACGACMVACRKQAVHEQHVAIGSIRHFDTDSGLGLVEGRLNVGSSKQTLLIGQLKQRVGQPADIVLFDAPPGTNCSVVQTIHDMDYVVLVTEPTPLGLYDMTLMVELLREMDVPFGCIVNKAGIGTNDVYAYLEKEGIDLLGTLPFHSGYAKAYATGTVTVSAFPDIEAEYASIAERILSLG